MATCASVPPVSRSNFARLFRPAALLVTCLLSINSSSGEPQWQLAYTVDGHPDLQGVWANNSITPLERARGFEDRQFLSDAEYAHLQERLADISAGGGDALFGDGFFEALVSGEVKSYDPTTGNYDQTWLSDRNLERRTSLIVDPANGRLPAYTEAAQARVTAGEEHRKLHPADSWTDRPLQERCITYGMPYLLAGYNSYYQFVQSRQHVAIIQEMIHDVRIIPLVDKPHIDEKIRLWHGDSRGYWDGDTLVIETRNFSDASLLLGSRGSRRFTERFRRTAQDTLSYQFTIDDPTTWTAPWTAVLNYSRGTDPIYEYACHEANYSMSGILSGHRAEEARARPGSSPVR